MSSKLFLWFKQLYPWMIWVLSAGFFFYKYLLQVSPSVMSSQLMSAYSLTGAGLGNLAACFFYAYLLMQIPVGLILDRWSPRLVTAAAVLVCALSTLAFAHAQILMWAQISRFMMGLAAAFAAVSCFKLTAIWFPKNRFALVSGLSMTAAMLGAVGGEAPLSFLVGHFGWRHALGLIAVPGLILALLMVLFIRDKKQTDELTHQTHSALSDKFSRIFCNKQTWLLSLYSGFAFAPVSVFGGLWGVSFIEKTYHCNALEAASAVSLIFIGFAVGCPGAGWFSDYIGRRKPVMLSGTILALATIVSVLYLPLSSTLLQISLFLFGFGASGFFVCFAMIREINPLIFTATVLGFMNTFDSICEAITEPFIGYLLDLGWDGAMLNGSRLFSVDNYRLSLFALPVYFCIALGCLLFVKETYCDSVCEQ